MNVRISRFIALSAAVIALLAMPFKTSRSQSLTCNESGQPKCPASMQVTLVSVPVLTVVSTASSTLALQPTGGITYANYASGGYNAPTDITLTVRTNNPTAMKLLVAAQQSAFSGTGCTLTTSNIKWGTASNARTTPLSASSSVLTTVTQAENAKSVTMFFAVTLDWTSVKPAPSCLLPLLFTLSA